MSHVDIKPLDAHNQKLVSNVHPPEWTNPRAASRYNLVVIGAGTAGLVTAAASASLGAKVALVERSLLGGDCLNVGCVPSKAIIRSSRVRQEIADATEYGVRLPQGVETDFPRVMERLRRLRAKISEHDSVQRFSSLGIDVFLGSARFTGKDRITVEGAELRFKKAVIATGASPVHPPIEGLKEAGFRTNETIFELTEQPRRLAVVGGGPIGSELSQAFARLGTEVTLIERESQFLNREDSDAAAVLEQSMLRDGVDIRLGTRLASVRVENGCKVLSLEGEDGEETIRADEILVGVGRSPNVQDLGLENAEVEFNLRHGVEVNDYLQTSNSNIYAAGDVALKYKFTHTADASARIVVQNALFPFRKKASALTIPWCTYTSPEIAHVGYYEDQAQQRGIQSNTFKVPLSEVDRAILDGQSEGFVKIHVKQGSDEILGATIVAQHAGEMISEITLAMVAGIGLGKLSDVIHPYPTQAEAIRKAADAYQKTRLTGGIKTLLNLWLRWTR